MVFVRSALRVCVVACLLRSSLSSFSWCSRVADEISVSRGPFRISLSWSSDRCVVCWRDVFRGRFVWKFPVSGGWLGTSRTDLLTPRIFFVEALKSCWQRCCRRRPRVVLAVVLLVVDFRIRVVSLWTRFPVRRTGRPEVVFWEGPKTAPNGSGPARGPKCSFS